MAEQLGGGHGLAMASMIFHAHAMLAVGAAKSLGMARSTRWWFTHTCLAAALVI